MKASEAPILRFYAWQPACLSLGRFQKVEELSTELRGAIGVDWVRRPTGGRAVWHDQEITYSLVLREELLRPDERSIAASYRCISEGFLEGLRLLGIQAQIAPSGEQRSSEQRSSSAQSSTRVRQNVSSNCFDLATRADFVVDGRKLLGAAQCRKNGAILQHGSLLIDVDEDAWKKRAGGSMSQIVTLKSLGVQALRADIIVALRQGVERTWKTILQPSVMTSQETELADFLCKEKYYSESWNTYCHDFSGDKSRIEVE